MVVAPEGRFFSSREPTMKYAIACVADQTWAYLDTKGSITAKHPEARLWDGLQEASIAACEAAAGDALYNRRMGSTDTDEELAQRCSYWLEAVEDEDEFRARKDTW